MGGVRDRKRVLLRALAHQLAHVDERGQWQRLVVVVHSVADALCSGGTGRQPRGFGVRDTAPAGARTASGRGSGRRGEPGSAPTASGAFPARSARSGRASIAPAAHADEPPPSAPAPHRTPAPVAGAAAAVSVAGGRRGTASSKTGCHMSRTMQVAMAREQVLPPGRLVQPSSSASSPAAARRGAPPCPEEPRWSPPRAD